MTVPRLSIVLSCLMCVTLVMPVLRSFPGGMYVLDLWLLLLLLSVPVKVESLKRGIGLVVLFGLCRSSVSAIPIWSSWAALGLALPLRALGHRHITEARWFGRLAVGMLSGLPMFCLDERAASVFQIPFDPTQGWIRVFLLGCSWMLLRAPLRWRYTQGEWA
ncbi:MAG: hypothetical protein MK213_04745 [Planctomycetes bacterium]|nr:hypothetical protein [Planctomycetota bacterium]